MSRLQKLKTEIQSTLKQEKKNIFEGHHDENNHEGWIEALEYCIREIELLELESNDLDALRIKKKAEKLNRRINEDTGDYNFEEQK